MIYIIVFIFLLIPVILFDIAGIEKGRKIWYYLEFILLVLLAGLRYRVGGDTLFYMSYFDSYPQLNELSQFDFENVEFNPFWYIFNAITKFIHDDFTTFQIIQALIVNSVFFWFFKKHTEYYFSAILMYYFGYYCYFNMEILREILSICLFMISLSSLNKQKYLNYYLWCIIAIFFHPSAAFTLFIPLFQFIFKKINLKTLLAILLLLGIVLSMVNIIPLILKLFSFNELILMKLEVYTEPSVSIMNIVFYYTNVLPICILIYTNNKMDTNFSINNIKGLIILLAILMIFSSFYQVIFARLSNYLIPIYILFLIDSFYITAKHFKLSLNVLLVKVALFIVIFFQSYYYWRDQSEFYPGARFYTIFYPYYSVLNPTIDQKREDFLGNLRDSDGF